MSSTESPSASSTSDLAGLRQYFSGYWKNEAIGAGSPLYAALCDVVAADADLLALASQSRAGQPAPNMLFAAVHALLEQDPLHPLADYYRSFGGSREPDDELGAAFIDFCTRWSEPIAHLLRTRLVQTNEVRRSAFLLPAFSLVAREAGQPLALVEIGPSAGLNLLFDRYRYDYRRAHQLGDAASPVHIDSEVRGAWPAAEVDVPRVASRTGIDINPLDVRNPEDAAWLKALVWPEHDDRRRLLAAAMEIARDSDLHLLRGDAVDLLPSVFEALPDGVAPCVFATFVLHQLSSEQRTRLRGTMEVLGRNRPFSFIVAGFSEFLGWEGPQPDASTFVKVAIFDDGPLRFRTLVHCHPHGRWVEYLHDAPWEFVPNQER